MFPKTHRELHALDTLHARVVAQVCEVLTGTPFKQSIKRTNESFDCTGLKLQGSLTIQHSEHFHPRPVAGADLPCQYLLQYWMYFQKWWTDTEVDYWKPLNGAMSATRVNDKIDAMLHTASWRVRWLEHKTVVLTPLNWHYTRCGFSGTSWFEREEFAVS